MKKKNWISSWRKARIALQQKLIETRKAEKMTQSDVACASGLSQQAVSRIETGSGATISSLIKYHIGIAVLHFYDQSKIYES